ncbi:TFIIH/NER complex ATP-dependent 5'-3' DNA helicase subunit [Tritrichomonas musculus]|uniref:TFIIH/NER complex ATP-dependent 5'-3' DNA helicase subunit n=1 Tax=Tritrichomonas musculus TaxID=1915356 RepID=A0ABR2KTY2_9EUKA
MNVTTLDIDGLSVIFPFPNPYPEQIEYMTQLKLSLDATGPSVLEMPSGTGKTVCILSLVLAYMAQNDEVGPLIYCTRTIPELDQGIQELRNVVNTRLSISESDFDKKFLGIALSARANLCILPEVLEMPTRGDIDNACSKRTIPWSDEHCEYFEHELVRPRPGVYGLSELKAFSSANGICPYYLARRLVREAQVIMGSFAYVLDPLASEILFKSIPKNAIVVFDEAHNIDDVCCEYMSIYVDQKTLEKAAQALNSGESIANKIREREQNLLQNAFENLKKGLQKGEGDLTTEETLEILSNPLLPSHIMKKAMPKSLIKFEDFNSKAKKLLMFLGAFLEGIEKPEGGIVINNSLSQQTQLPTMRDENGDEITLVDSFVERYSPKQLIETIQSKCEIEPEELSHLPNRFKQFLTNNKVPDIDKFQPLLTTLDFASALTDHNFGYNIFVEPTLDGPIIMLYCVDSTIAFKNALNHFSRIIITSGTLSPLSIYPVLLGFEPVSMVDFTMSFSRRCLLPLIVTKGDNRTPLSSSFRLRSNPNVAKSYGDLLLSYCQIVPDGIICFFPSYVYMQLILKAWNDSDLFNKVLQYKLIFMEAQSSEETSIAFENYRKAIEFGRGAVFIGVARGRVSEGIDFADHYGRCVLLFGLPVRNTQSTRVQARADFVEYEYGMNKHEFILFDAMRAASQCVGRLLRSKNDYGIVVMADRRYAKDKLRSQLPHWIKQFINENKVTVTIEQSIDQSRDFLLQMAQPFKHDPKKLIESSRPTKQ